MCPGPASLQPNFSSKYTVRGTGTTLAPGKAVPRLSGGKGYPLLQGCTPPREEQRESEPSD